MAVYSIKDTTLTALGDAVRSKTSETKVAIVDSIDTFDVALEIVTSHNYYFPAGTRSALVKRPTKNSVVNYYLKDASGGSKTISFGFDLEEITLDNITDGSYFHIYNMKSTTHTATYEITSYDADGNIIQVPGEVKNTMTPAEMAEAIEGLPPTPPDKAFNITGNCNYRFAQGGWDWFIEMYRDKITTSDISAASYMFDNSTLDKVPFDINCNSSKEANMSYLFSGAKYLTEIPKITGKIDTCSNMFNNCYRIRELKEESVADLDWSYIDNATNSSGRSVSSIFNGCSSLRKYPNNFLAHGSPKVTYTNSIYYSLFGNCYVLDEVVDLPVVHREATWTSNVFYNSFKAAMRLKRLTFETNADGSPIKINTWSKQAIDLSGKVGYATASYEEAYMTTDYNSGITKDKAVKDDATYQALKNDLDWYAMSLDYCRYNKTSALETINTLPDLSGGAGGNSIKFKGAAGAKTDGGAINTMTQEEIAVATAKGWTVSFA